MYPLEATTRTGRMLNLVNHKKKFVVLIQYGVGTFDGCGPTSPRVAEVSGRPGLYETSHHKWGWWTELVWPARPGHPDGRYGLSGNLPPDRMLRMARSMPPIPPPGEVSHNC